MSVVIETTLGDFTVDLFTEERPSTCKNFLKLCKLKYYNFSLFHTVQANFIAQTGDPTGTGNGGESVFGIIYGPESKYYEAENMPKIKHTKPGLLSMVNCGNNMLGSQFFVTLGSDLQSLDEHCVFAEVTEGQDVLLKLNEAVCDLQHRPYRDIRITHTVILEDPFEDLPGMQIPSASPDISLLPASNGRLGADEDVGEELTGAEFEEAKAEQEARARATILEIVGDIPDAEVAPPENVLFVCKLNPVTNDDDLELIFSRFGKVKSCEVIRDHITKESLQYAFIEFAEKKSCEQAYMKMDNVLIDDRRIHVDFSQSVSKIRWKGKGRGVEMIPDDNQPKPLMDLRYSSMTMMNRGREQYYNRDRDRRGRDDRRRDDGRRRRDDDRRDDRRRDDDRRRRPNDRHDSRRQPEPLLSRRHRDFMEPSSRSHGRGADEPSDSRYHRRHEDLLSQESNHRNSRQNSRDRNKDQPSDYKSSKSLTDKAPSKNSQDNGDVINKTEPVKSVDVSPLKLKTPPPRKEDKQSKEPEEETEQESHRNETLSQSVASDVGSVKHSNDSKKKNTKKKIKKKKRSSSTSSNSSDSSVSSSSSSSSSTSSSSSSSSRERIIVKKNGKSKKHKRSGTLTKKYYDHRGKLIKVIKKHRKNSSSSSESSSDLSDIDRKRSKKKHKHKRKKKYNKIKKSGRKSSDEDDDDSDESGSDDGQSKSSKTSEKLSKKRKYLEKSGKSDKVSEISQNEEDCTLSQSPEKKKLKATPPISLKKS